VVQQFARVAHATGFLYCYSILEANKRSDFRISMENSGGQDVSSTPARSTSVAKFVGAGVVAELNTFFPFDPFNLPKSQSWIKGVYREWSSVAIDDEEDEDEDEDEEEAGDSDGGGEHEADSGVEDENEPIFGVGPDDANFEQTLGSFEGMSISPVRRMVLV
jgi:RNA polymerase I-specific transcription initiation factor RRN3